MVPHAGARRRGDLDRVAVLEVVVVGASSWSEMEASDALPVSGMGSTRTCRGAYTPWLEPRGA